MRACFRHEPLLARPEAPRRHPRAGARHRYGHRRVADPFTLPDGTFLLRLADGRIFPNKALASTDPALYQKAVVTIARLGLDDEECCTIRRDYFDTYMREPTPARQDDLKRRAPFVWTEMVRQRLI